MSRGQAEEAVHRVGRLSSGNSQSTSCTTGGGLIDADPLPVLPTIRQHGDDRPDLRPTERVFRCAVGLPRHRRHPGWRPLPGIPPADAGSHRRGPGDRRPDLALRRRRIRDAPAGRPRRFRPDGSRDRARARCPRGSGRRRECRDAEGASTAGGPPRPRRAERHARPSRSRFPPRHGPTLREDPAIAGTAGRRGPQVGGPRRKKSRCWNP